MVSSQETFNSAHNSAAANDSILWENGVFADIYMNITKSNLHIGVQQLGETVFNGSSRVRITGDFITLEGMQFVGGDIGTNDVINTYGSYGHFNEINIRAYTCYKYLRIREESQYCRVTYCNFENRLNLDDQNILSILVDEDHPGYHKIQYCSFKNFAGTGNDMGIEPIRIGVSTQADFISRSLVEYCYFTACDGDGELISSKATQNVYRYNTFDGNTKAELVLRHGSQAIVYGNFFLNGKGGVRVREGQDHYIYNNYFYQIDDRPIYLQNDSSDPLDRIHIAFNTILHSAPVRLGGSGSYPPENVTFANNIFGDPLEEIFETPTGTESWLGNIATAPLGIGLPATGLTLIDPQVAENSAGFFGLNADSPAIDAAAAGYALLPQFEGMDAIDTNLSLDLMQQTRPTDIAEKDLGCSEYPQDVLIQPFATIENTGPHYNTDIVNATVQQLLYVDNLITVTPNPAEGQIRLILNSDTKHTVTIELFDSHGGLLQSLFSARLNAGQEQLHQDISSVPSGTYWIKATSYRPDNGYTRIQTVGLIKA